jgi:hypothetical protein
MKRFELVKREDHYGLYNEDGHKIAATIDGCNSKLSKENCDEIFGVVDVDVFIDEMLVNRGEHISRVRNKIYGEERDLGRQCFNKAMELNKDKVFTLEDMKECWYSAHQAGRFEGKGIAEKDWQTFDNHIKESFSQPTEIAVEIVTYVDLAATPVDSRHPDAYLGTDTGIPFLDENGCLILKRI